ncbi:OmpA family protein [Xanthocytophaga agilis]|uniref:OmpA family protein n=1 Tax=Xanthocytophaga agilis TaxID=3048010 RepID=A0AAE3UEG3_9BACT|nr:OmpA family protein [Xanthocytophaga agilis]MDJ1502200.1 OmpA family protein [Xanthocytophaga agilis]
MKKIAFFCWVLLIALTAQAQSAKKLFKEAEGYFEEKMYSQALELYLAGLKLDPENPKANFNTGLCYLETAYKEKSLPYLKKTQQIKPDIHKQLLVFLGEAYQYNHQFSEALKQYQAFLNTMEKDDPVASYINRKMFECNNGIRYMKDPAKATINNIGSVINSKYADFAPVISADETVLVFTSRREGSTGEELSPEDNQFYEDMYISYKANGKWSTPRNLKEINTDQHDACVALSSDGKQLFIYKDKQGGDLYYSDFDAINNIWSKPQSLGDNVNTKYYETSISMTSDGQTIYFSSNRPGGSGGLDIYMSHKTPEGKWGEAVNLGPSINTPYDEDAPFIHADGTTLYFSSRGLAGMGGYDIYRSEHNEDGTWTAPENLGYPINTANEDIYFVLSADNKHGYYASAKEGGVGEKDIYIISMPPRKTVEVASQIKTIQVKAAAPTVKTVEMKMQEPIEINSNATIVKGKVIDAETKEPLIADVVLVDNITATQLEEHKTDTEGAFSTFMPSGKNYNFSVQKEGYLFHSENFDIPEAKGFQQFDLVVELKKINVGSKIVLRNIFFDFDKATLRKESTAELENLLEIMQEMPKLKIEISGHTDNKGSAEYNKTLSGKRAKAVVDYLISKGIPAERMRSAGYGKERPIAANDTDEGRQLNRRTEFEIIGK